MEIADYYLPLYDLTQGLQQFQNYHTKAGGKSISVSGCWVSEKYDGVRAVYLGGKRFVTAKGDPIVVPSWFLDQFPPNIPLDGELYLGPELFNEVSGLVRQKRSLPEDWRQVVYHVFDMPVFSNSLPVEGKGYKELDFETRQLLLGRLIPSELPNLKLVEQRLVDSEDDFEAFYQEVIKRKGEGVILTPAHSLYQPGKRSSYKVKPLDDSEAVVIGYREGNGKNAGQVGSLCVLALDGLGKVQKKRSYNIGTGLSQVQRKNARQWYPIGSVVVCQYNGLTSGGVPRFPRLKGLRADVKVDLDESLIPPGEWVK
jgi:DNA ligase-1